VGKLESQQPALRGYGTSLPVAKKRFVVAAQRLPAADRAAAHRREPVCFGSSLSVATKGFVVAGQRFVVAAKSFLLQLSLSPAPGELSA
jgi:hypothetical protein